MIKNPIAVWPKEPPKNIIVRMPNWIGDAVMATPLLADLRKNFPTAEIRAMCLIGVASVLQNNPYINEVITFHKPSGWLHRLHHFEVIDMLVCGGYDLGVLTTNSFSSAWWFWRGHVKNRIGFKGNGRSLLLNQSIEWPKDKETTHLVTTYKQLLLPLGIPISDTAPQLFLTEQEERGALEFLSQLHINPSENIVIGINPGAAYGSAKCWLPESFNQTALKLLELDPRIRLLFFGDSNIRPVVANICANLPEAHVSDLAGKTNLRELMALFKACKVILSNDSGPMHIAAALNKPLVALFGSTNPTKTGPYSSNATVIYKAVACSPCYQRVCPIDMRCMKEISVDEVVKAIKKYL